ncbi:hydroxylysine kinase-like [Mercenaria mercenaria]|uniref:hydroxylysine kinase-like n=1 Tax=Mercenaria mercenaria TaxID=6596 RepID=UPI00234E4B81|nr:hydroxylysine kinase-like [Mercenaria mercenaria]XP_053407226.1 hydroxylysine kinase-like [Mercenaria mercenaria]
MSESNNNEDTTAIKHQNPEEELKPRIAKDSVPDLVYRLYGLKVREIKELPSYDDLNFFFHADNTIENKNIKSVNKDGYVLKVMNSLQSSNPEVIDAQHALCQYVRERGVPTQVPILNIDGREWSLETFHDNENGKPVKNGPYLVRLVTFVPGKIFHETPYVPGSFYNVGIFVGKLHKAMTGFRHSFYDNYTHIWIVGQVPAVRDFLKAVTCKEDVAVVNEVIDAFEDQVVPELNKFTKGVVHGDVNEQNTIMYEVPGQDNIPPSERVHDVNAMLDFADVSDSYKVYDIAICIAYLSIDCPEERQADVGGHVLAGYFKSCSLNEDEFEALKILVCARLCQSLVYGAHSYAQQPGNTYLLTTSKGGWPLLHKLWQIPSNILYARWKEIMKQYK